jgi:hypothetical protein
MKNLYQLTEGLTHEIFNSKPSLESCLSPIFSSLLADEALPLISFHFLSSGPISSWPDLLPEATGQQHVVRSVWVDVLPINKC